MIGFRRFAWIVFATGLGTSASCSPARPDLPAAAAAVLSADSAWAVAAERGDVAASAEFVAEDGIMFPPGAPPVVGRAAARQFMQEATGIPGFSVTWQSDTVIVAAGGDLAYAIGRSRYTFADSTGAIDTMHAKAVSVWRRESDGRWRAVVDIWNEAPELPPIRPAP
ncbi:MAG TPA: DUF4440 domain-containing protein [Gemmatimonadales bacterium]|nr:DUF4440 domain-containing protein [Gemmatimonadales bacterium]